MLKNLISIFKAKARQDLVDREQAQFRHLYTDAPTSYADRYPEVPKPYPMLSLTLLAARWTSHDLHGEDMPALAADLLESGLDSPSLRRLAGEMNVACSADVEELVGRAFCELSVPYPFSETNAKAIFAKQVAREVIAGKRNAWAAANHLEIAIFGWAAETADMQNLFELNDEIDWDSEYRRPLKEITSDLIATFARIAAVPE